MAYIHGFGAYLPERVVSNDEMAGLVGSDANWIRNVSGIEERRFAAEEETVASLGGRAAQDCLAKAGVRPEELGLILVSSGSSERRFPGPAVQIARLLGLDSTPAIDLPVASAGSLIALSLASELAGRFGKVLVVAAEKMSSVVMQEPMERGVAVLFGDGAGACLVSRDPGPFRIIDFELGSDGNYAEDLRLEFGRPLEMNGRSVILHASRKMPRAIETVLERNGRKPADITHFVLHQANQNLTQRVSETLGVPVERFHSNIAQWGNTSSASMLIAAEDWFSQHQLNKGEPVVFAAFGAGFQWGALLAEAE